MNFHVLYFSTVCCHFFRYPRSRAQIVAERRSGWWCDEYGDVCDGYREEYRDEEDYGFSAGDDDDDYDIRVPDNYLP